VTTLYRDGETRASTSASCLSSSWGCDKCDGWTCNYGGAPNPDVVDYTLAALGRYEFGTGTGDYYFDGALRDVRLYARALPSAEIADIAGSWTPPTG
jgi:hypothetical protein